MLGNSVTREDRQEMDTVQQNVIFGVLLGVGIVALGLRGATDLQAA